MANYYRPNLSPEQRDIILALLKERLGCISVDDERFEASYRAFIKVKDCREIRG